MSLAPFVRIVARGKGRARAMTFEESQEAMTIILQGRAAAEAVGALLMVLRLRGETDAEIAGFTAALRAHVSGVVPVADLDWPSYAAGRTRGAPLYLLAARLVAQAGYRVSLHGWNTHQAAQLTAAQVQALVGPDVRYHPLADLCPEALALLALRDDLGLRSCINTVLRMWNPSGAAASVQGVFHPSYRGLQARAAAMLGQQTLSVIKGGGGEFERHPSKEISVFGLRKGAHIELPAPALWRQTRRLHDGDEAVDAQAVWKGHCDDGFAQATVIGTAALALWTLDAAPDFADAEDMARTLWATREKQQKDSR
ncbi:MAG: glycosyl transferase family protein [Sulfitobacter sp.]